MGAFSIAKIQKVSEGCNSTEGVFLTFGENL